MRFAVIADIHSNFYALEAVVEDFKTVRPDFVVVAGDFINRGPQPREVMQALRAHSEWTILRGNHEDYVIAQCCDYDAQNPLANPIWQPARWTAGQLHKNPHEFSHLPIRTEFEIGAQRVLVVHGLPHINNDGVFAKTSDDEIREMLRLEAIVCTPDLFICAHTHAPLHREVEVDGKNVIVVNVGALGLPFNGDTRAQYGVFTWQKGVWNIELRRIEYSMEATLRAFETGGFSEGGGPLSQIIRREVETARPHLGPWVRDFAERVRCHEMTVAQAVEDYLALI